MTPHLRLTLAIGLALAASVPGAMALEDQTSQGTSSNPGMTTGRPPAAPAREYTIGVDDVLEISVWENASVSRTVPVRPDGRISLPLLNDVQAAGLTPMQLQKFLTASLEPYIKSPMVSIIVREVHSFKVSVVGRVKTPGRYELTTPVTVLDMIAIAGGLGDYAEKDGIVVFRREGTDTRTIPFAYSYIASGRSTNPANDNFMVRPNDIVMVR
ncbi:MAG TPA: polysaccharide biosynthesis/export family protein [Vicinamibacterales bacterium]|nr:polysaccharide biosynthesis/export family protein [Vicinamibacterales bacterium]